MPDPHEAKLIREATSILLRLRDAPDDEALQRERDDFLQRGQAEKDAYTKLLHAWQATDPGDEPGLGKATGILAAACLAIMLYWSFEPVRIFLLADISSDLEPSHTQLDSGDRVTLDASSALIDNTAENTRKVTLLRGAAFFDVAPGERPFAVSVGDIRVEVLGTSFEAGYLDDEAIVTVAEGSVRVFHDDRSWQLGPGDRLLWSETGGAVLTNVDSREAASWRRGLLIANGMSLAQIADILDRRLPGNILIAGDALGQTPIVGTFDLSDPLWSLRTLAELEGARVFSIPSVVTIVRP